MTRVAVIVDFEDGEILSKKTTHMWAGCELQFWGRDSLPFGYTAYFSGSVFRHKSGEEV